MKHPRSTDIVLIVFAHQWEVTLADGYDIEDVLHVDIVHKAPRAEWLNSRDELVSEVYHSHPACGSKIAAEHAIQAVDRRVVNLRNVRKCQRSSCFGGDR